MNIGMHAGFTNKNNTQNVLKLTWWPTLFNTLPDDGLLSLYRTGSEVYNYGIMDYM